MLTAVVCAAFQYLYGRNMAVGCWNIVAGRGRRCWRNGEQSLLPGATGYIGGRLTPRIAEEGYRVRVLARSKNRALSRSWAEEVEIVEGDVQDRETLAEALSGVDYAHYLIHSMGIGPRFHELDIGLAREFGKAAKKAGVKRIVYLGGLGDPKADLSKHLRSRHETGQTLRESGVPVTEFRAAVIVGSGSISFEMVRYLEERLPVMVCPKWIYSRIQPIAIINLLDYLVAALNVPESAGKTIEIGCTGAAAQGSRTYDGGV